MTPTLCRRAASGLTLVELLCALVITAVVVRGAAGTLRDLFVGQTLLAQAASLETDVHYARTLALTTDHNVRLSVQAHPQGGSCTVVHTGPAHACRCSGNGQARCENGALLLRLSEMQGSASAHIVGAERSLLFAPGRGTVTPTATLVLRGADGRSLHKVINVMGRMRTCSDDGLAGLQRCSG